MNYDWTVTIDGVNVSALVIGGGTIDYGRPTRASGFQSPVAQFDLFTQATYPNYSGTWPTVNLGDPVIIHVTWDGVTQHRRFTGVVQALDWNPGGLRVTAAGTTVDWQALTAGATDSFVPITDELETTRVDRLCDDAGVTITIEGVPARRVRGIPVNSLDQPLLDSLLRIADDCDALLLEDRLGVVHYRTRNFDRPTPYTIPSGIIERDSLDLAYERGTHINAVRVYYGEPDATTGQQLAEYDDDTGTYGTVSSGVQLAELYTDIQYKSGAEGKAAVYLEKNRLEWEIPDLTLLMNQATGVQADAILDLQENWMVTVDNLPTGCPIASYDGDILGFTDIMSEQDYRIVLHLGPRIADTGAIPEEPIFAVDSITGGTTSTYEDEFGFLWQVHVWDTAGTYTPTCNTAVTGDLLLIGGGGGGGGGVLTQFGGGGGAGAVYLGEAALTPGTQSVTVGAGGNGGGGGTNGSNGGTSKFNLAWCYGGGGGGAGGGGSGGGKAANAGGYGGGGGQQLGAAGAGTYGSLDGGVTTNTTAIFGGAGSGGSSGTFSPSGGGKSLVSAITGSSVTYAVGGAGSTATGAGSGGAGGTWFSGAGAAGRTGIVVYRYRIA